MKPLLIEEVRKVVRGWRLTPGKDLSVGAVSIDSRTARPGDLFVAIQGDRFDGHDFLSAAAEAGCAAAIVRRDREPAPEVSAAFPGGVLGVLDTVKALGELGSCNRHASYADVVAVTGSNGKTTVKLMIHHILSGKLKGIASARSYNNEIGVPLTLLEMGQRDDYVVVEIGTNAPGEVAALGAIAEPDVGVVTSVGPSHLERLGSIERVAAEKVSLVGKLRDGGLAVINGDGELLRKSMRAYEHRAIYFGTSEEANLRMTGHEPMGARQRFEINGRLWAELGVPGKHNAINALAALAVAQRFGFELAEAVERLASFEGAEMRLEHHDVGGVTVINDAYNANPASLTAAADVLADSVATRRVLVAGDMLELGDLAEQFHFEAGRDIAQRGLDLVIGVGSLGRHIAEGAGEAGKTIVEFAGVDEASEALPGMLREGDVVLIKGSRQMRLERLVERIVSSRGGGEAGR